MAEQVTDDFQKLFKDFLHDNRPVIIDNWLTTANLSEQDPFYGEILSNAWQTIELVISFMDKSNEAKIVELTHKIAKERTAADVDISVFVSNIQAGRKAIDETIYESDLTETLKLKGMRIVAEVFDLYTYHAVKEYSRQKDYVIQNKNRFIQEMHHDRLTLLGQLAASFAHEIRNPLTSIKGFIGMLKETGSETGQTGLYFDVIDQEMKVLEENVSRFLLLSRQKGLDDVMEKIDFSILVTEMASFMYPLFADENISVTTDIEDNCIVCGAKDQLEQVVLNILNNAVEALTKKENERCITVKLHPSTDGSIVLSLSNNGMPIPGHLLDSIFEPFITTKELKAGLGLSVSKQVVEKHNGLVKVTSCQGVTTFMITLPQAD
ncbi:histidine kinase N-terminal domain-containing protein [Bacillus marinisedimentorum]|uniref:histidine kinase N-terminal domain-containing protein n=1 Tax=Bacillus marinisedimentorum TaxID=1821260 RepID=UPI000872E3C6|nr:histidine kinase N-terminal domain-containing protein [Bacillus marinisedimentorum]